jgi:hypothetical protein
MLDVFSLIVVAEEQSVVRASSIPVVRFIASTAPDTPTPLRR